jgi:hypothetical protein
MDGMVVGDLGAALVFGFAIRRAGGALDLSVGKISEVAESGIVLGLWL